MLHPKKSILQVKIERLRNNCRHVTSFKLFLCRKCALKIWRGTYCVAGRHNCGFWLANKLVQTNTAAPLPQGAFKTQLYFSKPKQAKLQAKNRRALKQGRNFKQWPHGKVQSWPRRLLRKRHQNGSSIHWLKMPHEFWAFPIYNLISL